MKSEKYSEAMRRRWQDPAHRQKLLEACRKRSLDLAYRAKMSAAAKGPHPWNEARNKKYKHTGPRPKHSATMKRVWDKTTERGRALRDLASQQAVKNNRSFGGKHEFLDRRGYLWRFKSLLELALAQWLDQRELDWLYEPHTLLLSDGRRYTPDFWVAEWGMYLEAKGRPIGLDKVVQARLDGHQVFTLYENLEALQALQVT